MSSLAPELANRPVVSRLRAFNPEAVAAAAEFRGELTLTVPASLIRGTCEFLRADPELTFNFLADLTAVDRYPAEPRFEIIYHLYSVRNNERLRLKTPLPGGDPRIDSVVDLWPGADVLEREVFDLFGVRFASHPNLRRLMMPEDWEGHPLRKDYPVEGFR